MEAELGLWSNVQFTFDVAPGMAIYEEDSSSFDMSKLSQQTPSKDTHESTAEEASAVTFETLSQYFDYEITEKHEPAKSQPGQLSQINTVPAFLLAPSVSIAPPQVGGRIVPASNSVPVTPTSSTIPAPPLTVFMGSKPVLIQPNPVPTTQSVSAAVTPSPSTSSKASAKRLHNVVDQATFPASPEGSSPSTSFADDDSDLVAKIAAEEDKRRRNTAASARFRIKKKQREQTLERTAREMTQKTELLEGRVRELEMEVKWLRGLIVEKDSRLLDVPDGKKVWLEEENKEEGTDMKKLKK